MARAHGGLEAASSRWAVLSDVCLWAAHIPDATSEGFPPHQIYLKDIQLRYNLTNNFTYRYHYRCYYHYHRHSTAGGQYNTTAFGYHCCVIVEA